MIQDAQLRFSQAQSLIGAAQTIQSTNIVDLGVAGRNIGRGEPMRWPVTVDTTLAGGASVTINYMASPNPDGSSAVQMDTSGVLTTAAINAAQTAGTPVWDRHVPSNAPYRYVFLQYVTAGTFTAGALTAGIVHDTDANPYYAAVTGY